MKVLNNLQKRIFFFWEHKKGTVYKIRSFLHYLDFISFYSLSFQEKRPLDFPYVDFHRGHVRSKMGVDPWVLDANLSGIPRYSD